MCAVNPCGAVTVRMRTQSGRWYSRISPGARTEFPAKEIVDAGFPRLVRYGIRGAQDPIIQESLRVVMLCLR